MVKAHRLKPGPAAMLYCLASYAEQSTFTVYGVRTDTLGAGAGLGKTAAKDALRTLRVCGLAVLVNEGGRGAGSTRTYRLAISREPVDKSRSAANEGPESDPLRGRNPTNKGPESGPIQHSQPRDSTPGGREAVDNWIADAGEWERIARTFDGRPAWIEYALREHRTRTLESLAKAYRGARWRDDPGATVPASESRHPALIRERAAS